MPTDWKDNLSRFLFAAGFLHAMWGFFISGCDLDGDCTFKNLPSDVELTTESASLVDAVALRIFFAAWVLFNVIYMLRVGLDFSQECAHAFCAHRIGLQLVKIRPHQDGMTFAACPPGCSKHFFLWNIFAAVVPHGADYRNYTPFE